MSEEDFDISAALANVSIAEVPLSPGPRAPSPDRRSPSAIDRAGGATKPTEFKLEKIPELGFSRPKAPTQSEGNLDNEEKVIDPTAAELPSIETDLSSRAQEYNELVAAFLRLRTSQGIPDRSEDSRLKVVISPLSYKHAFPRTWLPKRALNTVVERPERLDACALGIGAAATLVPFDLVASTRRTSLKCEHVIAVHGQEWPDKIYSVSGEVKDLLAMKEVEVPADWPSGDIYMAAESIVALEAVVAALEEGVDHCFGTAGNKRSFVCARPPGHHCAEDAPSGFCIINNAHIAIQYARLQHQATHAVILDFDLHHGDGSQSLCWKLAFSNEGKPVMPIGYFSIHDIHSFPTERGYADANRIMEASTCFEGHGMTIWNVHLKPWTDEQHFNRIYDSKYSALFKKAAAYLQDAEDNARTNKELFRPLIVVSAGFDGSEYETQSMQRHKVSVPTSFFNRFTRDSVALAERYSEGRILSLLEGGYSTQALATGVSSHLTGLAGRAWEPEWASLSIADEYLKGSRVRWKRHSEFPGHGIQLGRCLFPSPGSSGAPKSSETTLPPRVLRNRTI